MKIGFFVKDGLNLTKGGGFSYINRLVHAIDNYSFHSNFDIVFLSSDCNAIKGLKHPFEYVGIIPRIFKKIPLIGGWFRELDKRILFPYFGQTTLQKKGVDLTFYLSQAPYPCLKSPFIVMNWDIGHLSTYPFPEFMTGFYGRQKYYDKRIERALLVFAESESGKEELLQYTKLGEHKVRVVPLFAGGLVELNIREEDASDILKKYNLTKHGYFLYPAQYWAHKNHIGLLNGFVLFLKKNPAFKLIMCGSDKGNKQYIRDSVNKLGVTDAVLMLGFVTDEELSVLYKNAMALVMATFFGPTNMPPIEAMDFNTPVVCSGISGHKEILGDAGIYFDPQNYNDIANGLAKVVENRVRYVELIRKRRQESVFNINHALQNLDKHISEAMIIRSTWR